MKDLDEHGQQREMATGMISGYMVFALHELSTAAGSQWVLGDDDTIDIVVTKQNAESIYGHCKEIRSGYNVGISRKLMRAVKEARMKAHEYLYEEANNPNTTIERKIELVKLTGKGSL